MTFSQNAKAFISYISDAEYNIRIYYRNGKGIKLDHSIAHFMKGYTGTRMFEIMESKPSYDVSQDLVAVQKKTAYSVYYPSSNGNDRAATDAGMIRLLVAEINSRAKTSNQELTTDHFTQEPGSEQYIDPWPLVGKLMNDIIMDFHPSNVENKHFQTHVVARYFQVKPVETPWLSEQLVGSIEAAGSVTVNGDEKKTLTFDEKVKPIAFNSDQLFFIEYMASESVYLATDQQTVIEAVDATKFNRLSRAGRVIRFVRP